MRLDKLFCWWCLGGNKIQFSPSDPEKQQSQKKEIAVKAILCQKAREYVPVNTYKGKTLEEEDTISAATFKHRQTLEITDDISLT